MKTLDYSILHPGDCLLYRPSSILDWLVCVKTGSRISHVEVFYGTDPKLGDPVSIASRPGIGVDLHPLRLKNLAFVRRPKSRTGVSFPAICRFLGRKYDWLGLFCFFLAARHGEKNKFFCSELATTLYRLAIVSTEATIPEFFQPFNPGAQADHISPADFYLAGTFNTVWSAEN